MSCGCFSVQFSTAPVEKIGAAKAGRHNSPARTAVKRQLAIAPMHVVPHRLHLAASGYSHWL
jgi:hypothetical protein